MHGDIESGTWLHNPVTGELARLDVGPAETAGRSLVVELWLRPGAAVPAAHVHPDLVERFEVLEGEVAFEIAGVARTVRAGDGPVEVGAGVAHDWWNASDATAHVRVEVEACPDAPGRPAARFLMMIQATWSLGALGRVDAKGLPRPLWLAALAREYRDVMRLTRPPAFVQAALFIPLAALARRTGHDPLSAELQGPGAACVDDRAEGCQPFGSMTDRPRAATIDS